METHPYELKYYINDRGQVIFRDWLHSLRDRTARAKIRVRLDRVEDGNFGDCEPVGEGVMELRIHYGPGYRVYFALDGPKIVLLLCGGDKGSQPKDIQLAKEYWRDYKKRGG